MALNTYNQMTTNNSKAASSIEKLSSGLRINSAADDAAGLAISEKMRSQIRGLDQASRNAQDGISMIQTAEGALDETEAILQRMRELSVQSSNDTYTAEDREAIQDEINQLTSEIDRISSDTEFNNKSLLDGSLENTAVVTTNGANIDDVKVNNDTQASGDYDIITTNENFDTAIDATVNTTGATAVNIDDADGVKAGEYQLELELVSGTDYIATVTDADGNVLESTTLALDNSGGAITSAAVGGFTFDLPDGGGGTASDLSGTTKFEVQMDIDVEVQDADGNTVDKVSITDATDSKVEVGGFELDVDNGVTNGTTEATVNNNSVTYQIGANAGQTTQVGFSDMSSEALGVSDLDLTTSEGATAAIDTLDAAIKSVSSERSKLGAMQNRLDHTINNLSTSSENLTAAESRIRDVDMASEMMEMTKWTTLQQSSNAMMAQANQQPQQVLSLLQ